MNVDEYKKQLHVYEYKMVLLCTEDEVRALFDYFGNYPPLCVHVTQHGFSLLEEARS